MQKVHKVVGFMLLTAVVAGSLVSVASAQTLRERDERARAMYQEHRQQYMREVNFYRNARQQYLTARNRYNQLRNAENKADLEQAARDFLERAVSTLISQLETIRVWISNRGTITEGERQAILAEIDRDIAWLQERLPRIQTAPVSELRGMVVEIRDYWQRHRWQIKRITGKIEAARIEFILGQAERLGNEVQRGIEQARNAGRDTTQLEAWYAEFEQNLNRARTAYENARNRYQAISNLQDADRLLREVHQFVLEANGYIRSAHAQLTQIVRELRS